MKVLIISANPAEKSYNLGITDAIQSALQLSNVEVVVRDLYRIDFDPILTQTELKASYQNQIDPTIAKEQKYLNDADICIWVYPLWWGSMPAIMRGYIDRVFSYGFAYTNKDGESVGLLGGKRNFIIHTIGNTLDKYELNGMTAAVETITNEGIFKFCGSSVEKFFHIFSVYDLTDAKRNQIIDDIAEYFVTLVSQ